MSDVACITTTSAAVAQSSVVIAKANSKRMGFIIWNNGANSGYLTFGPTSTSSAPQVIHASFTSYTWPFSGFCYTGPISAIRNAGTGTFTIAEFQAI